MHRRDSRATISDCMSEGPHIDVGEIGSSAGEVHTALMTGEGPSSATAEPWRVPGGKDSAPAESERSGSAMSATQQTQPATDARGEHPVCDPETRLAELSAKVERGEGLTMAERIERQGIIFNHHGNITKIKIKLV
jgi:hypothetical protein